MITCFVVVSIHLSHLRVAQCIQSAIESYPVHSPPLLYPPTAGEGLGRHGLESAGLHTDCQSPNPTPTTYPSSSPSLSY